jgi:hypothetical protein
MDSLAGCHQQQVGIGHLATCVSGVPVQQLDTTTKATAKDDSLAVPQQWCIPHNGLCECDGSMKYAAFIWPVPTPEPPDPSQAADDIIIR